MAGREPAAAELGGTADPVQARLGPRVAPALGRLDLAPLGRGVDLFEHRHVVVALAPLEVLGGFAGLALASRKVRHSTRNSSRVGCGMGVLRTELDRSVKTVARGPGARIPGLRRPRSPDVPPPAATPGRRRARHPARVPRPHARRGAAARGGPRRRPGAPHRGAAAHQPARHRQAPDRRGAVVVPARLGRHRPRPRLHRRRPRRRLARAARRHHRGRHRAATARPATPTTTCCGAATSTRRPPVRATAATT